MEEGRGNRVEEGDDKKVFKSSLTLEFLTEQDSNENVLIKKIIKL